MALLAAAGVAILVLLAGNVPTSGLGAWNLRVGTRLPWAVVPAALYLWAYWRFMSGTWGPTDGAAWRRSNFRANRLSARVWGAAVGAGLVGFAALLAFLVLASRLVRLPAGSPISTPADMPAVTAVVLLAMQSIVAGVSEESAFRGYMQSLVEQRYGLVVAILSSGTLFGLLHFGNHPGDVLLMLPYYIAVSAVYGGLTWAANSILPAVVLHSIGDVVVLTRWWHTGRPEWQVGATAPALVWESGVDAPFVAAAIGAVVLGGLTTMCYRAVRGVRAAAVPAV